MESIRLIQVLESHEIGGKRNFAGSLSNAELIAHWDDDDYSAPGRLNDQVFRLVASGQSVTGYHSMRFTNGREWWKYHGAPDFALGTSLLYRRAWLQANPFPSLQVGEDNEFVSKAAAAQELITSDAGDFMYATIHPGNTSPRNLTGDVWELLREDPCINHSAAA